MTRRQLEILSLMVANHDTGDGELIYERGRGFIGDSPVASRTVLALLRLMAINLAQDSVVGSFERYTINETGRALLRTR